MDDQSFNRLYNERMADLNITLGAATPEEIEETKELQEELVALHETKRYRESIAGAAQSFAIRHETDIEKELKGGKGRSLKNIFYDDFYANNIDNLAYQEGSPEVARLKTDYDKSVETAKDRLQKAAEAGREIRVIPQRGWVFAQANKGLNRKEKIGRFYLNLKPEHTGDFFAQAAEEFGNAGLNVDMKIAETGNAGSFNRPDKMVIYFNEAEEQQAIQALEKLHHRNQQMFETGRPRFAARVSDSSGREMPGLGFGEEPSVAGGKSFGEVRTEILAEVYSDAKLSGSSVSDPDFDFEASFRKACRMYNVDPANTAFNLSTPSSEFSELRRRAA